MSNNKPKNNYKGDITKVSGYDICQTPPHALEPLYPLLERYKDIIIWESACGPEKLLYNALVDRGYNVIGTDLRDGDVYNYFTYDPGVYFIQVTNPPWSIKYRWIQRAFELNRKFALLVPYETTFAANFRDVADKYNNNPWPIEILAPERRINFKMPNTGWSGSGAQMPVIWLTWGLDAEGYYGPPYITTYDVNMRNVKYDEYNKPIERKK